MKTGAERIAAERQAQIGAYDWTDDHDDGHDKGELAMAAVCYAAAACSKLVYEVREGGSFEQSIDDPWPWESESDKRPIDDDGELRAPTSNERIRLLEKAGALIAAEIDRLLRVSTSEPPR